MRDNAIVFSVEHVRLIVTADMVIIPRDGYEKRPNNIAFVELLEDSIAEGVQVCFPSAALLRCLVHVMQDTSDRLTWVRGRCA